MVPPLSSCVTCFSICTFEMSVKTILFIHSSVNIFTKYLINNYTHENIITRREGLLAVMPIITFYHYDQHIVYAQQLLNENGLSGYFSFFIYANVKCLTSCHYGLLICLFCSKDTVVSPYPRSNVVRNEKFQK